MTDHQTAPRRLAQCPTCYGRGYKPEARRTGPRNYTRGPGFYARTCWRCRGCGEIDECRLRRSERPAPTRET